MGTRTHAVPAAILPSTLPRRSARRRTHDEADPTRGTRPRPGRLRAPQHPSYLVAPADPAVGVRPPGYASVTAGVRNYNVVEPLDWRELNRRVAPGAAPERDDSDDAARRGR